MKKKEIPLERGIFILSLDFELAWGMHDLWDADIGIPKAMIAAYMRTRTEVVDALLRLFQKYDISATWATVGYMFHDQDDTQESYANKHIQRLATASLSCTEDEFKSIWLGDDLITKVQAANPTQDIGSHTYSHVIFSDPTCTADVADREIAQCVALAKQMDLPLKSFVFPRNEEAHHDVLQKYGFTSYRSVQPGWVNHFSGQAQRWAKFLSDAIGLTPPLAVVEEKREGLWGISASAYYRPAYGKARFIPNRSRVGQSMRGINKAIKKCGIYHLYLHPSDMAFASERLLDGLEQILNHAAEARQNGQLDTLSMAQMAGYLQELKNKETSQSSKLEWAKA